MFNFIKPNIKNKKLLIIVSMTKIFKKTCKKNIKKRSNTIKNTNNKKSSKNKSSKNKQYGGALRAVTQSIKGSFKTACAEFRSKADEIGYVSAVSEYGPLIAEKCGRDISIGVGREGTIIKKVGTLIAPTAAPYALDELGVREVKNKVKSGAKQFFKNTRNVSMNKMSNAFYDSKEQKLGPDSLHI